LDARRVGERRVPAVAMWLLRAQIGVVYAFAGLAKLHGDWLAHGLPLGLWLPARADTALVGPLLERPSTALALSWAGALFDCTIVVFLCWRRTRLAAWLVVVAFHAITWLLFPVIGVFPLLMVAATTVFFDPDWPRRLVGRLRGGSDPTAPLDDGSHAAVAPTGRREWVVVAAVLVWALVQVALPLRHHLYEGDHRWSGEGLRHGWNVMLVEKAGDVSFRAHDPATGATWRTDARDLYTEQQWRVLSVEPELIRQAAHTLADEELERSGRRVEVRVDAQVSLNGRPSSLLIDPDVDLADEPWRLGHQRWILPAPTDPPR
ncbi:MAG: HTTM domain-containing protein, partial [Microthrixaceae bacterium]